MSMSDPIADMLTRIRNGLSAGKPTITMPSSKAKTAIAKVLADEGFVTGWELTEVDNKATLNVTLKYYRGEPVIEELTRVSKPGWWGCSRGAGHDVDGLSRFLSPSANSETHANAGSGTPRGR